MTAGDAQARTSQGSSAGGERANYDLQVENYWHNGDGTVDVKFSVVHPQSNWRTYLCWAEQGSLEWWETLCGENEIMWLEQDGEDALGWRGEEVDEGWATHWRWYVWLDASNLEFNDMDTLECGVTYDVKFHKGVTQQSIEVLIECPTEEEEEECTECPFGGVYDDAGCSLGGAPEGMQPFVQTFMANGYYAYTPTDGDCAEGEVVLRNGCGVVEIPPDVEPFIWQDGFYYDPICE